MTDIYALSRIPTHDPNIEVIKAHSPDPAATVCTNPDTTLLSMSPSFHLQTLLILLPGLSILYGLCYMINLLSSFYETTALTVKSVFKLESLTFCA
jgi:hypothetical protein